MTNKIMINENSNLTKIISKYYLISVLFYFIFFFITLICGIFLLGLINALLINIFNMGDNAQTILFNISSIIGVVLITAISIFLACKVASSVIKNSYTKTDINKITKNTTITYALSFVLLGMTFLFRDNSEVKLSAFLLNMIFSVVLYYYFSKRELLIKRQKNEQTSV